MNDRAINDTPQKRNFPNTHGKETLTIKWSIIKRVPVPSYTPGETVVIFALSWESLPYLNRIGTKN